MKKFVFICVSYDGDEGDDTFVVQGEAENIDEARARCQQVIEEMARREEYPVGAYGVHYVICDGVIVEGSGGRAWRSDQGLHFGNTPEEMNKHWK